MTGYQSKKAAAQGKLTVDRTQVEQWLQSLKDIDALHHSQEPESVDAQKAIADMAQALAQPEPVKFKCTVVDDQHPQGILLEQWGDPPAAQPAPVPCCGKYETCTQACTPRGKFLGAREAAHGIKE